MSGNRFNRIQKPYFDWLESTFGNLAREAIKGNVSASVIARDFLSLPRRKEFMSSNLPTYCERVISFWQENNGAVTQELRGLQGLKARFGGDIGPNPSDFLFEKTGIYFDTIVVPDPLLRVATILPVATKQHDYYFLTYAISQLLLKDMYLADVNPPIAVLVAEKQLLESPVTFSEIGKLAEIDTVLVINEIYGTKFDTFAQTQDFFRKFKNEQEATEAAQRPQLLFWDEFVDRKPEAQLQSLLERSKQDMPIESRPEAYSGGNFILLTILGRMMQSGDLINQASEINAQPLIPTPVSYEWMVLKARLNQNLIEQRFGEGGDIALARTNALLNNRLNWLSNVPVASLVELRRKGCLSELRTTISSEIENLSDTPLDNLPLVAGQIDYNLSTALENHQDKIHELDAGLRGELVATAPSLLASVTAAIAPLYFSIPPSVVSGAVGLLGASTLKEIFRAYSKRSSERRTLNKTPIGILWTATQDKPDEN